MASSQSRKQKKAAKEKTPEQPEESDEHPNLEDDPGAWGDQDCGWTLGERMPN